MKKLNAFILAIAFIFTLGSLPQTASASEVTRGLHAVDRTVSHALGAKKCRDVREKHWSHRAHRWVWTTTRVCRNIR